MWSVDGRVDGLVKKRRWMEGVVVERLQLGGRRRWGFRIVRVERRGRE